MEDNLPTVVETEPLEGEVVPTNEEPKEELFTKVEQETLDKTRNVRNQVIDAIMEKSQARLHNDPELIDALSKLLNAQDAQALGTAKLRQTSENNKQQNETTKLLITSALQAVNKRMESIENKKPSREERHVEVQLVDGQIDPEVKQFTMEELEESVKTKKGDRPEDILKGE